MATIRDVAKAAGVSVATVSRIINNKGEASPETIARVQQVIQKLHYRPNSIAKSLSKRRSNLIALLIPTLNNPFFPELVREIEAAANQKGFHIFLCNTDDDRHKVKYYLDSILSHYACAAIINSLYVESEDLDRLESQGILTLTIDRAQFSHPYSAISVDHQSGAKKAVSHLLDQGCRKIIHLSGPKGQMSSIDRLSGYQEALNAFNPDLPQKVVYAHFDLFSGYQSIQSLIQSGFLFDGIFCSDDALALGAMRACLEAGFKIPDQVKIVGYDNILFSRYVTPSLSTISQHMKEMGNLAITEIISLMQQPNAKPKKIRLQPDLVIRESSTQLRGNHHE
ncbi:MULTISPECIES: LacI family DNA-binding transcriptional regulator [Sporolactobacillus]|jgi:LacI family transcriptional regulator|uniref:Ribose operon repressor n=2 Tax=Sporolactobacillus TaxID=2077 RepID=A0A4Y1ZEI0_9BACL|nr:MULTISPECIES: LacI family DNA-binding transcriptional regulator [Sporolactobacillus]BBN99879.1 LacI family transcriptional regulator [Sporolactobacillus terrae]GAY77582.1 ribose operon repressor [Sporolactobacillus inulinus]GEB76607.1 LacI family transcriptional regulator [Sporolactobacillus inulinus]